MKRIKAFFLGVVEFRLNCTTVFSDNAMGDAYDAKLKSRIADMMNVGGRDGGAITAAQFLARFVKPEVPWCHLDIAGTALLKTDSVLAPKGATGWGVMALDRLIRDRFER